METYNCKSNFLPLDNAWEDFAKEYFIVSKHYRKGLEQISYGCDSVAGSVWGLMFGL